jgi:hypothetical protein
MKRLFPIGIVLASLLGVGLALPGLAQAQEAPKDMVAFSLVVTGKDDPAASYTLPLDPPVYVFKMPGKGEGDPIGKVTIIEQGTVQLGMDGKGLFAEVTTVVLGDGGDAIFMTRKKGLPQRGETAFLITGGKGRFKHAAGSGMMTAVYNEATEEFACTFQGLISAPK